MGGELVRFDFPDPTLLGYGVIAPDQLSAIYIVASLGSADVMLPGRVRFPGLDPDRRYRIRPVPIGVPPSGLNPPTWWGTAVAGFDPSGERHVSSWGLPADGSAGVVLSGAALAATGVMAAGVHPEHAIVYRAEALD